MPISTRSIQYSFRWPVHQTGDNQIVVEIPMGQGPPIINPQFIKELNLSDGEIDNAEYEALRSIALVR